MVGGLGTTYSSDTSELISLHLSPPPSGEPFGHESEQLPLFYLLSPYELGFSPDSTSNHCAPESRYPTGIDPRNPVFWSLIERFAEELFELDVFKRLDRIYVNPQFASTSRGESVHEYNDMVGRMTRGAHVRDVVRIAIFTMKSVIDGGGQVSAEEIFMTVFSSFCHDIMVSAFSHLSQDDLHDRGIDVDHDVLIAYGVSQAWSREACARWGLDHKRMVAASLPPSLLLASEEARGRQWRSLKETLNSLISADPDTWEHYKKRYGYSDIESVLDFSLGSGDQKLFEEKRIRRSSQRAHDLFDIAYARTDHTQRELLELEGVALLNHGEFDRSKIRSELFPVDFMDLPENLCGALAPNGIEPSGSLRTCFVEGAGGLIHIALLEENGSSFVLRAISEELRNRLDGQPLSSDSDLLLLSSQSEYYDRLQRIKVPKAVANYYDLLQKVHPLGDGNWRLRSIKAFLRTFLALGDYQSERVAAPIATLGRAFFATASKCANDEEGISPLHHIFGDHETCVSMFTPHFRGMLNTGYETHYSPVLGVRPFSSRAGPLWVGPTAPDDKDLDTFFAGLTEIAEWLDAQISGEQGHVICAPSATVKKKYELDLSDDAYKELNRRSPKKNGRTSRWITRRAREEDDLFTISFFDGGNKSKVEFHYRLHRGFEIWIESEKRKELTPGIRAELFQKVDQLMKETRIKETGSRSFIPVERLFQVEFYRAP